MLAIYFFIWSLDIECWLLDIPFFICPLDIAVGCWIFISSKNVAIVISSERPLEPRIQGSGGAIPYLWDGCHF